MADKLESTTGKPQKYYVKDITGADVQTASPEHAASYLSGGTGKLESKEEAYSGAQAASNLARVEQMGVGEKTAYGVGSGLTLGLGPAAMAGLGLVDQGTLSALGESGAYQAGDIAGMVAPALLTGGESVAGRGLVARALSATPAGLLGRAGTVAEAFAGRVLPEAGVLGKLARPTLQMASRGATEGALINLSHTASDAIIQDKPLTWASISASIQDGALMGGLVGGGLGFGTAAVSGIAKGAIGAAGRSAGGAGGEVSAAKYAAYLGAGAKDIARIQESELGILGTVKGWHDILGGVEQNTPAMLKVAKQSSIDAKVVSSGVIDTLTKEAPNMVPELNRTLGLVDTSLKAKYAGTMLEGDSIRLMNDLTKDMGALRAAKKETPWNPADVFKTTAPEASASGTWKGWADTRSQLAELVKSSRGGVQQEVYRTALNAVDSEVRQAMERASESIGKAGLDKTYHGALLTESTSDELVGFLGKKAGKTATGAGLQLNGGDVGALAYSTLLGHPIGGAAIVAGKKIVQHVQHRLEPVMAEAAYRSALGAQAGAATQNVGAKMTEATKRFLSTVPRVAETVSEKVKYDRKSYESAVSSTNELTSGIHRERVQQFSDTMSQMGHPQMAKEVMDQYQRATDYLNHNKPTSSKTKQSGTMGKMPTPFGLDTKEQKFMRIERAVKHPLSILDDLQNGNLSREAVKAVKYVYPPLLDELAFRTTKEMLAVKNKGRFVSADKIAMLGAVLDYPIDSKLDKGFIDAVQSALAANAQPQPSQSQQQSSGPAPVITESSSFQTPIQNSLSS